MGGCHACVHRSRRKSRRGSFRTFEFYVPQVLPSADVALLGSVAFLALYLRRPGRCHNGGRETRLLHSENLIKLLMLAFSGRKLGARNRLDIQNCEFAIAKFSRFPQRFPRCRNSEAHFLEWII